MIIKNINGVSYWKIESFSSTQDKIEVYLYGYFNQDDNEHVKLFVIDCPTDIIQNINNYDDLINLLENYITSNVSEFQV
jgi:hypothetical protein